MEQQAYVAVRRTTRQPSAPKQPAISELFTSELWHIPHTRGMHKCPQPPRWSPVIVVQETAKHSAHQTSHRDPQKHPLAVARLVTISEEARPWPSPHQRSQLFT